MSMASTASATFLSVSLESWLTIAAIIIGPLAALLIQKYLEDRRAQVDRRVKIFRDLMANRASRMSAPYVAALNGIETEFFGQTRVLEAWRNLNDHLYTPWKDNESAQWNDRTTERLNKLLHEMGESLGYHFDEVTLKRNVYYPAGWSTIELEQTQLRQAAVKVFEGEKPLRVEVINEGVPEPAVPAVPNRRPQ
jgi:hypothetical protein